VEVVAWPEAEVPGPLRAQQVRLQLLAWPSDGPPDPAPWHDPALRARSVLLVDDGTVVAALDVLRKPIRHAGREFDAEGLSAVVSDPRHRGRGHGLMLVRSARDLIAADGADLGIFTCDRPLQGFYERAGWRHLPGTVLIGGTPRAPFPSDQFDKVAMGAFFSRAARAAEPAFAGARIELYPGEIDRLW
jgi:GNAT superfamily N-acetyltransferase